MKKKIITLALLSLFLVGCNKASDSVATDSPKTDDTSSKKTETSATDDRGTDKDTDGDGEKINEKDALLKELQTGITNFRKNDQSLSYDIKCETLSDTDTKKGGYRSIVQGTFDPKNGLVYDAGEYYEIDSTTETETLYGSFLTYIGTADSGYRLYYSDGTNNYFYKADKYSAQYYYEKNFVSEMTLEELTPYLLAADSFASASKMIRYIANDSITEFAFDIEKVDDEIVLSISTESTAFYSDPTYLKFLGDYSITVKDGFVSKFTNESTSMRIYPNGYEESTKETTEAIITKGFDETLFKNFDPSSYTDKNQGMAFEIPIYCDDYYYSYVSCSVDDDIQNADVWVNYLFDGLYYDKDFTIPYNSRKPTMNDKALYVKLKTSTDSTKTIIYHFEEVTIISYENIILKKIKKTFEADSSDEVKEGSTTEVSWDLDWHFNEENRDAVLEKMYVNGVETTEDSVDFTLGTVNTIKHTLSTYNLY